MTTAIRPPIGLDPGLLSRDDLLRAYRTMRVIREFEERVHKEFATGEIPGFVHLYAGEEAVATGVCDVLKPNDYIASTHRGHGHALAKGCDVKGMMAEIYGKATGLCHGKGGSMHIADIDTGMLGANGIVGGGPPLVCGVGLTSKVLKTHQVGISFTGDGGSNQGTFLESLNLASVWDLPVVFIIENNGYAESTSNQFHQKGIDVARRAEAFGMPGMIVNGQDYFEVREAAQVAIDRARSGGGPSLLECKTVRYYGHFEGDQQKYREPGEVERARAERDPLVIFEKRVTSAGILPADQFRMVDAEVLALIEESVIEAKAAPQPTLESLLDDVYVSY
ncbi:thiamine pyrophosphate-dependent dehydrogenase E1 component subunit alpha [Brooklawnia cerclae]|uniref:Pyruvate dehydrogenase E1 component alpha subunit n=1 Tax=Brooklawnia cerclae TaxID=349934 RepID=A0ABX0SJH2_9ACTN|nr:thiamine pyrophosphate-dependent dehydrogenase E1 component subunit alpha [Brooklawnia cerclae]NIH56871.1 pyruvate dehydrogenase E1 component alpha subunit [Brooklawnia cerclae]